MPVDGACEVGQWEDRNKTDCGDYGNFCLCNSCVEAEVVVLLGHAVPWCVLGWLYTIRMGYVSPEEAWLYSRALTEHLRANPVDMGLTKMPCFDCHRVRQILCVYKVLFSAAAGSWVEEGFCAHGVGVCRHFSCPWAVVHDMPCLCWQRG